MSYTKLFSSITASTIWRAPDHTRLVWITMLAMANKNGYVFASVPGLADMARVPIESCVQALKELLSPDEWSRTKENEGRRIEEIDGGWRLLNYIKHRDMVSEEERREYMKRYMREYRKRNPLANVSKSKFSKLDLTHASPCSSPTPTPESQNLNNDSASAVSKRGSRIPANFSISPEMRSWALANKLPNPDDHICEFVDYWSAKAGIAGYKLDWQATFRNWLRRVPQYHHGGNGNGSHQPGRIERTNTQVARAANNLAAIQAVFGSVPEMDVDRRANGARQAPRLSSSHPPVLDAEVKKLS